MGDHFIHFFLKAGLERKCYLVIHSSEVLGLELECASHLVACSLRKGKDHFLILKVFLQNLIRLNARLPPCHMDPGLGHLNLKIYDCLRC